MGSFNSSPKIYNIDSQDDDLKIPQGYPAEDLLKHLKSMKADNESNILKRYFLKPLVSPRISEEITDGLRVLRLNSISRGCSSKSSSELRIFQWNLLSQSK